MADIVLATINARYIHCAFGLRYLLANMGDLRDRTVIEEFEINHRPIDICERLLEHNPRILGFGVYIWNAVQTLEVVRLLKSIRPEVSIILGGPEVSYESSKQEICSLADFTITGEADFAFAELCRKILSGTQLEQRIIAAPLPNVKQLMLPYDLYSDADVAHRVVYIEASRGCPFTCEFCLSSLDIPVRQFEVRQILSACDNLMQRGLRQFKFVDRTFNLNIQTSKAILKFFLDRYTPGLFVHFEMIPHHFPEALKEIITQFPPGALQFEVGIQTFNPEVGVAISRKQDNEKIATNLRYLKEYTGVHVHADLIVGLPGETVESFAAGFDKLVGIGPQEIQVGILKRLRGTPIIRHDDDWQMRYSLAPPYEILSNRLINFAMMQRMRRFARYWDLFMNSGNFLAAVPMLWCDATQSPFEEFMRFSDWLHARERATSGISLKRQAELLYLYAEDHSTERGLAMGEAIRGDYARCGREDLPQALRVRGEQRSKIANKIGNGRRQDRFWKPEKPAHA